MPNRKFTQNLPIKQQGWDEGRRYLLRCELDAAFFHLYGLNRDDAACIMDIFPHRLPQIRRPRQVPTHRPAESNPTETAPG